MIHKKDLFVARDQRFTKLNVHLVSNIFTFDFLANSRFLYVGIFYYRDPSGTCSIHVFNGCFNWMFPTCYMENGWDIIKHPSVSFYWFFGVPLGTNPKRPGTSDLSKPIVNKGQKLLFPQRVFSPSTVCFDTTPFLIDTL